MTRQILIFDIEIAKAIPTGQKLEGIEYCGGWRDFKGMGVAVIGFKFLDCEVDHCLSVDEFGEFLDIPSLQFVGFNNKSFDDLLLKAHGVEIENSYDLLEEIRIAAGFTAHFSSVPKGYSYRLDAIAKANGMAKTESGAAAPILWQRGERQRVIDYCKADVSITRELLNLGVTGELIDPNTGNKLKVRDPRE